MKKYILLLVLFAVAGKAWAQQEPLFTQYMFNPLVLNPAYAGSRDMISGVLVHRSQWVGIDEAPRTQALSVHSPIGATGFAAGIQGLNERIGPANNTGGSVSGAYHLPLTLQTNLSFGARASLYSYRVDFAEVDNLVNENDPAFSKASEQQSSAVPTFDAGLYLYSQRYYLGASVINISETEIDFPGTQDNNLSRHATAMAGYALDLSPRVVYKPSVILRWADGAPLNFDINNSFLIDERLWLGASVRSYSGLGEGEPLNAVSLIAEYLFTENLRAGYSYDVGLNGIGEEVGLAGSHEIFVGFDFELKKGTPASTPRYF